MNGNDMAMLPIARWRDNAGVVRLVGIGPLLAVTKSVVTAVGLGLATLAVLTVSSLLVSLLRRRTSGTLLRLPLLLVVIATLATAADLLLQAWSYPLYRSLGLFVPLIAANSLLLTHTDQHASQQSPLAATSSGLLTGLGYFLLLLVIGALREVLGTGALFADMQQLLPFAGGWRVEVFGTAPFLLALTPPGALLLLALLVALCNRLAPAFLQPPTSGTIVSGSKRVRVTGKP